LKSNDIFIGTSGRPPRRSCRAMQVPQVPTAWVCIWFSGSGTTRHRRPRGRMAALDRPPERNWNQFYRGIYRWISEGGQMSLCSTSPIRGLPESKGRGGRKPRPTLSRRFRSRTWRSGPLAQCESPNRDGRRRWAVEEPFLYNRFRRARRATLCQMHGRWNRDAIGSRCHEGTKRLIV
jgi:hypothetical protein